MAIITLMPLGEKEREKMKEKEDRGIAGKRERNRFKLEEDRKERSRRREGGEEEKEKRRRGGVGDLGEEREDWK
jgi:hypothetical protein